MAPPTEPPLPPTANIEIHDQATITDLPVQGALPAVLSGRLVGIGPSPGSRRLELHEIHLHDGRAVSYRSRWVATEGGPLSNIIVFGGSILAFGDDSPAYELTSGFTTLRRVDLAGRSRGMSAYPKRDPHNGDLHVLASDASGAQAHVVVSAGALTRTSRPILGAPRHLTDLAITRDHMVFVTDGSVGVMTRDAVARITWITTGVGHPTSCTPEMLATPSSSSSGHHHSNDGRCGRICDDAA